MIKYTFFQLKINTKQTYHAVGHNKKIIKILVHHFPHSDIPAFLQQFVHTMSCDAKIYGEDGRIDNYFYEGFAPMYRKTATGNGEYHNKPNNKESMLVHSFYWNYRTAYHYGGEKYHWVNPGVFIDIDIDS